MRYVWQVLLETGWYVRRRTSSLRWVQSLAETIAARRSAHSPWRVVDVRDFSVLFSSIEDERAHEGVDDPRLITLSSNDHRVTLEAVSRLTDPYSEGYQLDQVTGIYTGILARLETPPPEDLVEAYWYEHQNGLVQDVTERWRSGGAGLSLPAVPLPNENGPYVIEAYHERSGTYQQVGRYGLHISAARQADELARWPAELQVFSYRVGRRADIDPPVTESGRYQARFRAAVTYASNHQLHAAVDSLEALLNLVVGRGIPLASVSQILLYDTHAAHRWLLQPAPPEGSPVADVLPGQSRKRRLLLGPSSDSS